MLKSFIVGTSFFVRIKRFFAFIVLLLFSAVLFSQNSDNNTSHTTASEHPQNSHFQIRNITYDIRGITIEAILKQKVFIDTQKVFLSKTELSKYLKDKENEFKNIRTLEKVEIESIYDSIDSNGLCYIDLIIHTKDSLNFIIVPYPSYNSNSGFLLKIKAKDNNFLGTMQAFNFDLNYAKGKQQSVFFNFDFTYPYMAGPLFARQSLETNVKIGITDKNETKFAFTSVSAFTYTHKFFQIDFGLSQGFEVNKTKGANIAKKGYKYFFRSKPFVSMPINIVELGRFASLTYTPSLSLAQDWSFSKEANKTMQGLDIRFEQSLELGKVVWKKNFREGLSFAISNKYLYNTFKKKMPNISIDSTFSGYISFFDRIGIYSRLDFFYNFNKVRSNRAGENLRGILDKRISTDTALSLNLDVPIKVLDLDFEKITGKSWTRFLSFELHLSPFIDFAVAHKTANKKHVSKEDIWCSGGFEIIVFPKKFRSIYVRASLGFDLLELKNVPGIVKINGLAKKDGQEISEVFIGIGLHY